MVKSGPVAFSIRLTPVFAVIGAPCAWYFAALPGVVGFVLGASLSWASLFATSRVASGIDETQTKLSAQSRISLLLLAKLPVIGIVIFFTNSLGPGAISGFLAGYLLVYLALVLGALRKSSPTTSTDDPW